MTINEFENSRTSEGTMRTGAQHNGSSLNESSAVSRDDVRDGFAEPPAAPENSSTTEPTKTRRVLAASTLAGDRARNAAGEYLGTIEEIMLDPESGRIAYAVLSFGGFPGIGDKLFAVLWTALQIDRGEHEFLLDADRETLEKAPGFDKGNWPDMADPNLEVKVHRHDRRTPYWEHAATDAGNVAGEEQAANRSREYEPTTGYQARPRH
jgi:hypothetical protein